MVLLAREKLFVSVSMVGRILSALKRRGALHEPPKPAVLLRQHRKLRKRPWAIRKPKYWPIEHPGDLHGIQLLHGGKLQRMPQLFR